MLSFFITYTLFYLKTKQNCKKKMLIPFKEISIRPDQSAPRLRIKEDSPWTWQSRRSRRRSRRRTSLVFNWILCVVQILLYRVSYVMIYADKIYDYYRYFIFLYFRGCPYITSSAEGAGVLLSKYDYWWHLVRGVPFHKYDNMPVRGGGRGEVTINI